MKLKNILTAGLLSGSLALVSCSEKTAETTGTTPEKSEDSLEAIILTEAPEGAVHVAELRKQSKVGDKVNFQAKVIGSTTVMVDGRAIMVVGDPQVLTSCDLHPGDACTTPWDVCCDDHDDIKNNIVTVQVVDAEGSPLKQGLRDVGGIKELSELVITGEVAEGSGDDNMIVNATGIFVKK